MGIGVPARLRAASYSPRPCRPASRPAGLPLPADRFGARTKRRWCSSTDTRFVPLTGDEFSNPYVDDAGALSIPKCHSAASRSAARHPRDSAAARITADMLS